MGRHSAPRRGREKSPAVPPPPVDEDTQVVSPVTADLTRDTTREVALVPETGAADVGIPDLGIPDLGIPGTGFSDTGVPDVVLPDVVLGSAPTAALDGLPLRPLEEAPAPIPPPLPVPALGTPGVTPPSSRAGRNLPLAIGVGLALGALVLVPLFSYKPAFLLVLLAAIGVGIHEMVRAVQRVEARPPLFPVLTGGLGMLVLAWFAGPEALLVGLLLTLVALPVWRLADGPVGYQRDVTAGALVAVYVPFLAGFCVLLTTPDDGALRVVAFIVTVVCSDVGGYAAGVLFGRHPMAPTVSPKKSWEGFAGSVLACVIGGVCFLVFAFDGTWWQGVLYGVAIAVAATLGDLAESMIKRDLNIKDMGTLLPGHGGLMDRLDSLLLAAPVAYLLLTAFAPPH
jgi:phosphatidate cytidylyltransferase